MIDEPDDDVDESLVRDRFLDLDYLPIGDQSWMKDARCSEVDPELFYPSVKNTGTSVKRAVSVCNRCEVREQCLEYALLNKYMYGIWGGTTRNQRERILRDRRDAA